MRSWKYALSAILIFIYSPTYSQIITKNPSFAVVRMAPHEVHVIAKKMTKWGHSICYISSENPTKKYCTWIHRPYPDKNRVFFIAIQDETSKIYHLVKIYWEGNSMTHRWDSYTAPETVESIATADGLCSLVDEKNLILYFCRQKKKRRFPIPFERAEEDLRLDEAHLERGGLFLFYPIKIPLQKRGFSLHCRTGLFEIYGQK